MENAERGALGAARWVPSAGIIRLFAADSVCVWHEQMETAMRAARV